MFNLNISKSSYIDKKKLLIRLGHVESKQKLTKSFNELIRAAADLAHILINPRQIVNISNIGEISESSVELENGFVIKSGKVARLLDGCTRLLSFVVTIGPKLEQKRDYFIVTKEPTQAMLLDACGAVAVEGIAEALNTSAEKDFLKKGYSATKRYSPGYGDWQISAQKDFLDFLDAPQIGVKLSESFIMSPEKTISALIGLKPM